MDKIHEIVIKINDLIQEFFIFLRFGINEIEVRVTDGLERWESYSHDEEDHGQGEQVSSFGIVDWAVEDFRGDVPFGSTLIVHSYSVIYLMD